MYKTSMVSAVAALLALPGICSAQPPGITREMIATALPVEGAPPAEPGPYEVTSEGAFGSPGLMVFHPTKLDGFPTPDTLPVLVWGNGGCAIDSTRYSGFLTTIASHGFLVLGTAAQQGAPRRQATADDLRAAIDWAEKKNARAGSPLNGKIAVDKVAVMGQSCGGFLSISLGADPRVDTIGVFNSGVQRTNPNTPPSSFPTTDALAKLHGPVLLVDGHERDFMMATSAATFEAIDRVPTFYGSRHNAGHTATVFHPGGGEFANVASSWLMWTFKGDKQAAAMFVGKKLPPLHESQLGRSIERVCRLKALAIRPQASNGRCLRLPPLCSQGKGGTGGPSRPDTKPIDRTGLVMMARSSTWSSILNPM